MSNMPEWLRLAETSAGQYIEVDAQFEDTEYVRADIHAALVRDLEETERERNAAMLREDVLVARAEAAEKELAATQYVNDYHVSDIKFFANLAVAGAMEISDQHKARAEAAEARIVELEGCIENKLQGVLDALRSKESK